MKMLKYFIIFTSMFFASFVYSMPKIGQMAPDIVSKDFNLKDARGKFTVVYFYPKDSTANCSIEARNFAKYYSDFQKLGVEIVGVSTDSRSSHKKFIKKYNLPFKLVSDDGKLIKEYDVSGLIWIQRATFLVDPQGKIAHIWRSVNVVNHAQEVLKKIAEIKAGVVYLPLKQEQVDNSDVEKKRLQDIELKIKKELKEIEEMKAKIEMALKDIEDLKLSKVKKLN